MLHIARMLERGAGGGCWRSQRSLKKDEPEPVFGQSTGGISIGVL